MRSTLPGNVVLAGALVILGGAGSCDGDPTGEPDGLPDPDGQVIVAFDDDLDRWPRDDWSLLDASLEAGRLEMTVSYGGGCAEHRLWLLAVDGFHPLPDAGITPTVAVPLLLAHDADNDPCDALLTDSLEFRLQPLRDAFEQTLGVSVGRIILRVPTGQGAADTTDLDFTFQ